MGAENTRQLFHNIMGCLLKYIPEYTLQNILLYAILVLTGV